MNDDRKHSPFQSHKKSQQQPKGLLEKAEEA